MDSAAFQCRLHFPWVVGRDETPQLQALGALRYRVTYLVGPSGGTVTQTTLRFAPLGWGPHFLSAKARECSQSTLRLAVHGSEVVAVDFEDPSLDAADRQRIFARAQQVARL